MESVISHATNSQPNGERSPSIRESCDDRGHCYSSRPDNSTSVSIFEVRFRGCTDALKMREMRGIQNTREEGGLIGHMRDLHRAEGNNAGKHDCGTPAEASATEF